MNKNIKQFLLRFLLFCIIAFPFSIMSILHSYYDVMFKNDGINASEVYLSILKSTGHKKVDVLVFGDSVGKQLYDNDTYNDTIYSVACNQAISMAGHYFLLKNFIDANKGQLPKKVIFIMRPFSFSSNLDQIFTYNYFIKPFYKPEYRSSFSAKTNEQVKKIPFYYLSQFPLVLNSNWSPTYIVPPDSSFKCISPISNDYLPKIKALCKSNNIALYFYSAPIRAMFKNDVIALSKNTAEFERCGLKNEFEIYFKNVTYMPDSLFVDEAHFKKPYIPVDYFKLRKIN